MRLARQPGPSALLRLLFEIDATRAPLHPLLLQGWLLLTGPSDLAGRAFSAACGLLTVAVVYAIGRDAVDRRTGIWAAWLIAISPALVRYSREVRMYAWLVLLTCLAWWLFIRLARSRDPGSTRDRARLAGCSLLMTALAYSHPLGLLMNAALMAGSRLNWNRPARSWRLLQASWILAFAPWARFYVDHPPESVVDRASIRILLGMPIEFIGGNFAAMAATVGIIAWGLRSSWSNPLWRFLLPWFGMPPLILFAWSQIGSPLFGPARYTLFVAPAYLLMVAIGLSRMPRLAAIPLAIAGAALSASLLASSVYRNDLKADWRQAAIELDRLDPSSGVVVVATDSPRNVEVETARYYLSPSWRAVPQFDPTGVPWSESIDPHRVGTLAFAVGVRDGRPVATVDPAFQNGEPIALPGLNLILVRSGSFRRPGPNRTSNR